jgi:hypothetical protein
MEESEAVDAHLQMAYSDTPHIIFVGRPVTSLANIAQFRKENCLMERAILHQHRSNLLGGIYNLHIGITERTIT